MIPLISAVIPTYNRLSFLKEAVESVLGQTLSPLELIIADDGSTDGTEEYGATLLKESGIRYLRLKNSGLPGKVRNAGAEFAAGKYLAFLDSDDLWKPEKLERQLAFFQEHPDLPICHTRELWLRGSKVIFQSGQRYARSGYLFPEALKKCIIGPSTVMMRRNVFKQIGRFRERTQPSQSR